MKYSVFFLILAAASLYEIDELQTNWRFILIWPAVNFCIMSAAYAMNNPSLILGKKQNGEIHEVLLIFNFPWLLLSWSVWIVQQMISRENRIDKIADTNWYISSYPGLYYRNIDFDYIIDLTAEFPKPQNAAENYRCFPNLDGITLCNLPDDFHADRNTKVLIHCAQGHGRSATWCSVALARLGLFDNAEYAYNHILNSRPDARASKTQKLQILTDRKEKSGTQSSDKCLMKKEKLIVLKGFLLAFLMPFLIWTMYIIISEYFRRYRYDESLSQIYNFFVYLSILSGMVLSLRIPVRIQYRILWLAVYIPAFLFYYIYWALLIVLVVFHDCL